MSAQDSMIKQIREAFSKVLSISDRKQDAWDDAKKALALLEELEPIEGLGEGLELVSQMLCIKYPDDVEADDKKAQATIALYKAAVSYHKLMGGDR